MRELPTPMDKAFAQWLAIVREKGPEVLAMSKTWGGKVQLILEAHPDGSVPAPKANIQGRNSLDNRSK